MPIVNCATGEVRDETPEELAAIAASLAASAALVPQSVTPRQIRKAIRAYGLKAQVDAYIATLSDEVQEEWEFADEVLRTNALIAAAQQGLGMTDEQADALFRLAATF